MANNVDWGKGALSLRPEGFSLELHVSCYKMYCVNMQNIIYVHIEIEIKTETKRYINQAL